MTIIAAADGSALGNPGPAGWAWYVDPTHWASGGWPHGTNNMGELMAVLDLLHQTAHLDEALLVYCDSRYVIDSITKWMPGWKKKGWKKKDGKPVLNVDLMKQLDAAMAGRDVTFEWVKGHSGHHLNEEADQRANAAAVAFKESREPEAGPGWPEGRDATEPSSSADAETVLDATAAPAPVPEVAPEPEEDLFSLTDERQEREPTAPGAVPDTVLETVLEQDVVLETVLEQERALLSDEVRGDREQLESLLHPQWCLVGDSGQLWSRQEWMERVGVAGQVSVEVLHQDRVDPTTVLLVWRGHGRHGSAVHSTWWVREDGRWQQRFHHVARVSG